MGPPLVGSLLFLGVLAAHGAATGPGGERCSLAAAASSEPLGACGAGARGQEEEEGASIIQVQAGRPAGAAEPPRELQDASGASEPVITKASVLTTIVGDFSKEVLSEMVKLAWNYLCAPDNFQKAVGPFGVPVSFGVINDTPEPVLYSQFSLHSGSAWGHPAQQTWLQPGEMMQWFLYTQTTKVEASMLFQSGDKAWSVAVAQYRLGSWFTGCDRLRCNALLDSNLTAALDSLCSSYGGGVRQQGSYKLTLLLNEVLRPGALPASESKQGDLPAAESKQKHAQSTADLLQQRAVAGLTVAEKEQHRELQQASQTAKFVITTAVVVTSVVGMVTSAAINKAFGYFEGWDEFQWAVGLTGLPLTVGVINDTPNPVQYADFRLRDGTAWGYPAVKNHLAPGEMMKWFLYTQTTSVEATMLFQAGDNSWSVGVAHYRYGNLFTGCDRLRCNALAGADMAAALVGLCRADGGNPEAMHASGGYQVIVRLSKI